MDEELGSSTAIWLVADPLLTLQIGSSANMTACQYSSAHQKSDVSRASALYHSITNQNHV